jgi:glutaredoxin-related protein
MILPNNTSSSSPSDISNSSWNSPSSSSSSNSSRSNNKKNLCGNLLLPLLFGSGTKCFKSASPATAALSTACPVNSPRKYIEHHIDTYDVVIFTDWRDAHCQKTEDMLDMHRVALQLDDFDIHIIDLAELDQEEAHTNVAKSLTELTGQPTLPQVFVGGRFVGGYYQTRRALQRGDLRRYLHQASTLSSSSSWSSGSLISLGW